MPSRNEVLETLQTRFNPTELKDLCLRVTGREIERLSNGNHDDQSQELFLHCERHGCLPKLVQTIATLRPHLGWGDAPAVPDSAPAAPAALVNPFYARSTELVGREEEAQRVWGRLRHKAHCSLVGPSGSGKSALVETVLKDMSHRVGWQRHDVLMLDFRTVSTLREVERALAEQLGAGRSDTLLSLLRQHHPRLLVLENVGGMNLGASGLEVRRRLRGWSEAVPFQLLLTSNDLLNRLFRHDDPTRDSPFDNLDGAPLRLEPLPATVCIELIRQRLVGHPFEVAEFASLVQEPMHPKALLDRCAARYDELTRGQP